MASKDLQQQKETLYTFDQIGTEFIINWQVNDHKAMLLGDIC